MMVMLLFPCERYVDSNNAIENNHLLKLLPIRMVIRMECGIIVAACVEARSWLVVSDSIALLRTTPKTWLTPSLLKVERSLSTYIHFIVGIVSMTVLIIDSIRHICLGPQSPTSN
eukprot:scaffold99098_cov99-Cyclotella_meneghiniana.AAC.1